MNSEKRKLEGKKRKVELFQKHELDRNKSVDSLNSRGHSRIGSSKDASMDNIQIITNAIRGDSDLLNDLEIYKEVNC
jgi:hypothetical protein